jgi:hypothetical protein
MSRAIFFCVLVLCGVSAKLDPYGRASDEQVSMRELQ